MATLNSGDTMLVKGNNATYGDNLWFANQFTSTAYYDVEGNIMSLIGGDNFTGLTELVSAKTFVFLFSSYYDGDYHDSYLQSAGNLVLPATTLTDACYGDMFEGCTNLTSAPELPATTLASDCYNTMFYGCASLTTPPALPATTLADGCYEYMFEECTNLTVAPELPATTLVLDCYNTMFKDCTSLTTAPELPATTLADRCYREMFYGCTSLTTAPSVLPATTLAEYCYEGMFGGCSSLNYVKCLATDISANSCTMDWLRGVSSTGTFMKDSSMNDWTTGINGIPTNWTVVDAS